MPRRITQLGKWSVTSYKRSDKCEVVYVPLAFNIVDDEQRRDLLYVLDSPSRAGRVRECVRAMRTRYVEMDTAPMSMVDDVETVTDADILDGLI
jgi:hypothetical protein